MEVVSISHHVTIFSTNTRTELFNEYCQVPSLHRKQRIREINNFNLFQKAKQNKRGRKSIYKFP